MTATSLYRDTLRMPMAPLGPENPLPLADALLEAPFELGDVPDALRAGTQIGRLRSLHPYLMQDDYGRDRTPAELDTVVLDNGLLRAVFVPAFGGRLWSLTDLVSGRELLYANAAVQPANLALRNAWLAGGVEWNIGTKGHSVHTMAPLHAAVVTGPDGGPRLRMWELDRVRQVVFQIDAWLPEGARALHVYVRIENPDPDPVPMYWWSNAAVAQSDDLRVLAPADRAYATGYQGTVSEVGVPVADGRDHSWPATSPRSADYFYAIAEDQLPWVAGVDGTGHGLAIASTSRLRGRKLFCWGTGEGGRRWQQWLSPEGGQYVELQAGLAATQFEHVLMPACTRWDWVEVYGDVAADPAPAHGDDWQVATRHVGARVADLAGDLENILAEARTLADAAPDRMVATGSGWGALERLRRAATGEPWIEEASRPFAAATLGELQAPWHLLLTDPGADPFAGADPTVPPASYVTGSFWTERLGRLPAGWLRDYHLGVLAQARADLPAAEAHLRASLADRPTAWALRALARLAAERGRPGESADLLTEALRYAPEAPHLLREAMAAALAADRPAAALELFDTAPPAARQGGRVRLLEGTAAVRADHLERAEAVLEADIVIADLREGERSLSDLWREVFPTVPLPARYDFRMS